MVATMGWYPDPWQEHDRRWWDGSTWTGWVIDPPTGSPSPAAAPPEPDVPPASTAADPDQGIAAFLEREAARGVITGALHQRMLADLAATGPASGGVGVIAPAPPAPPAPATRVAYPPPGAAPPRPTRPAPTSHRVLPVQPGPRPAPPLPPPPADWPGARPEAARPHRPSPLTAELAIHGLAYAGVALVLTGVLGFVVFAFGDVGDTWRPLAEVATAAVLFGSGAFLRRRGAPFVGDVLVLLGGLVTPILIVAAFVDGAPVPPDLAGRSLAAALAPLMLVVGALFALTAHRRPDSPLRFLVAPMVWWAAAAAGLALGTTPLSGRDVADPNPWQWALVATAVAATLLLAHLRPTNPLAGPTRVAAWVGAPLAEAVLLAAAAGAGWPVGPILLAGVAAGVSAAVLLSDRPTFATHVQAALVVVTATACAVTLPVGWCAAAATTALVMLVERSLRRTPDTLIAALWLTTAGVAVLVASTEPWAGLTVAVAGTAWSASRLLGPDRLWPPIPGLGRWPASVGVVGLPLVGLSAAARVWSLDGALLGLAFLVLAAAAAQRIHPRWRSTGAAIWVLLQSGVVVALVVLEHGQAPGRPVVQVAALLLVALALAGVPRWPCGRVWMVAVAAGWAGVLTGDALGWSLATGAAVTGSVALALVALGQVPATAVRGHLAVMAHVVGAAALVAALVPDAGEPVWWAIATTVTAGAVGWTLSGVLGEAVGSAETDLWGRLLAGVAGESQPNAAAWPEPVPEVRRFGPLVPTAAALVWWLAVPPVVLVASERLTWTDPWLPVSSLVVALIGVMIGRTVVGRHELVGRTLGGAIWAGLLLGPAAVGWWPGATAALLIVAMAALSGPALGNLLTITFGWVASGVAAVNVAGGLGLAPEALHRVLFGWASIALLGSLVLDDLWSGRRATGEVIRRTALWPPFVLGASTAVAALAPIVTEPAVSAGWTLLGAAAVAFATAVLLRLAVVSTIGWAFVATAVVLLSPWDLFALPWLFVVLAASLLAAAEAAHDLAPAEDPRRLDRRWDLPPFVVGQVVAVGALATAAVVGWVPATWLAVAGLWAVVGVRLRSPWWFTAAVPVALVAAAVAGPGWLTLGLGLTLVAAIVAATRTTDGARVGLQVVGALALAGTWASLGWWRSWDIETIVVATSATAAAGLVALAVGVRWLRLGRDWLVAFVSVPVVFEATAVLLLTSPDVPRSPARWVVAAAIAATGGASGLLARPTRQAWLRWVTAVLIPAAAFLAADAVELAVGPSVVVALIGSLVAVLAGSVLMEVGPRDATASPSGRGWPRPILLVGAILLTAGTLTALEQWPDRPLLVLALGTAGVELLGMGLATRRVGWLAAAPWAFLAAWVTYASEALTGEPQWITLPLGLTILGMVEIIRWSRRRVGVDEAAATAAIPTRTVLSLVDLVGVAFIVSPALVEAVTRSPAYGLLAASLGAGVIVFAVLTRVRRRLIVGTATVATALILMIVPPLVDLVPPVTGWVPWALLALLGLAALMTAAFLEKGRQLVQRGLRAFSELTRDWE